MKIQSRILLGFGCVILVLVAAAGATIVKVGDITENARRIVELRVPTSQASTETAKDINASLAALRGWMLTGNAGFKAERALVWNNIGKTREVMDGLSRNWTNPENNAAWTRFKTVLDEFAMAQARVEGIAHSADERPATKILVTLAAPLAAEVVAGITRMIDREKILGATTARKSLLGIMADFRGTMGLSLASIRAYLLTGEAKFAAGFKKLWARNDRHFADLGAKRSLMTPAQRESFAKLGQARAKFAPLPPKMFAIRGSAEWNLALRILARDAIPRAGKLLTILNGPKGADGARRGGMVDNQKSLLTIDVEAQAADAVLLLTMQWVLLALGIGVALVATLLTARSIVSPLARVVETTGRIAGGDLRVTAQAQGKDEISTLARSVNTMAGQLADIARRTRQSSETISGTVATLGETVTTLTAGAAEQAASVSQTTSALQEIKASSAQMMTKAESLGGAAERAREQGEQGLDAIHDTVSAMDNIRAKVEAIADSILALKDQTRQIGEITAAVGELAQRSKLLALNAKIEASNAGSAGAEFSVLATEIERLADRSQQSAVEVETILKSIQRGTDQAVIATEEGSQEAGRGAQLVEAAGEAIQSLNDVIRDTAAASQLIVTAVHQNVVAVEQASNALNEINAATVQSVSLNEQTGQVARDLADISSDLETNLRGFKI